MKFSSKFSSALRGGHDFVPALVAAAAWPRRIA